MAGRGPWLQSLLDRKRESVYEWLKNAVNLLFVVALNVFFFLPLCAVAHPLFPGLMKDRGKQLPGSMMQTAFFQAGVFAGTWMGWLPLVNFALAAYCVKELL